MKITNTDLRVHALHYSELPPLIVAPGVNEVDAKIWAEVKKHPVVKIMLESGVLAEGEKGAAKAEAQDAKRFKKKEDEE